MKSDLGWFKKLTSNEIRKRHRKKREVIREETGWREDRQTGRHQTVTINIRERESTGKRHIA